MRKFWVSFLNGSLKYHADVIAGRQFHQIRMSKYLMIDSHHQLIVKCCYPWNVWEKCDPAWGDHFISSRYCVGCRFCQNSFCHFYQPPCAPEEKLLWIWARRVRESGWSSEIACCWRSWRNGETNEDVGKRQTSKVRVSMLFLVLPCWRSQGLSCMVSFSQKLSEGKDWRDRLRLRVLLVPLDLRNMSFQIFIPY